MIVPDPGMDALGFLTAAVTWLSPFFYTVICGAFAFEVVWQGSKWIGTINK